LSAPLPDRFIEDRAMRDAARAVLTEDIERLRAQLGEQGIASRMSSSVSSTITTRIRNGARDVLAQAQAQAGDHKGVLALLIGAIMLFLARGPILEWFETFNADDTDDTDDNASEAESPEPASEGDSA
jgi:hypothetical protein